MPADYAGNTLSKARGLDITPNPQTFTEWVGALDPRDYYRVTLSGRSSFDLSLNGLKADANVQLIQDHNGNGVVDGSSEVLAASVRRGTKAESITTTLEAGSYYIRVYSYRRAATNYNLSVSATPFDDAGNSLDSASNITIGSTISTYRDWVGSTDTDDFYQLGLNNSSNFSLQLNGLSADANVELLNSSGNLLASSSNNGIIEESVTRTLDTGTYYVRVYRNSGNTHYNLSLSATPTDIVIPTSIDTAPTSDTLQATDTPQTTDAGSAPSTASSTTRTVAGTLRADSFTFESGYSRTVFSGNGNVDFGSGSRDLLNLSSFASTAVTINYANTTTGGVVYDPGNGSRVFDAITLNDSSQILFEGIERIQFSDTIIDLSVTPNDPLFNQQWNLHMTGVHNAWRFSTGSTGVLVGVQDTGLATDSNGNIHADLRTTSFVNNNYSDESSTSSHGTSVQGIIAAASNNGLGISGINWNSPVMHIDVIGGNTGDYSLAQATQAMINEANRNGQRLVINLSLSGGSTSQFEQLVANNQSNVLFVIASGNDNSGQDNSNGIASPASLAQTYNNVIAVGASWGTSDWYGNATTPGERISYPDRGVSWWASQYGNGLTLMAPSEVQATNTTRTSSTAAWEFGFNQKFNGTSAAAPNVTGVASLLWSVNQNLTATQIREIFSQTAYDLGASGYDTEYGNGLVNADAAMRRAIALGRETAASTPATALALDIVASI